MSVPSVRECFMNFFLQCARNYGHAPTEITIPKPLATRMLEEIFIGQKEVANEMPWPLGDFKIAAPHGPVLVRINK